MTQQGPEINFLTFHTGRCGSTVMSNILNKHEGVRNDGEIYAQSYPRFIANGGGLSPLDFLKMRKKVARKKNLIYGCEVKLFRGTHLDRVGITIPEAARTFSEIGFGKFILLHRRNHLDRLISQLVANQRKEYVLRKGEQARIPKFTINIDGIRVGLNKYTLIEAIEAFEEDQDAMRETLRRDCASYLELVYEEDILNDPNIAVQKVAGYVGFEFQRQETELRKVVQQPKESFIVNYDNVRKRLRGTAHEWMLD